MANINNKDFILKSFETNTRIDGREYFQGRDTEVLFGSNGSVELALGKTRVFTKTSISIVQPYPSRPSEGFLRFKVDISTDEVPNFKKLSMEIEKIIEKVIKGSKALDTESLCIQQGKSVWSVLCESVLISYDGNLIDAIHLSSLLSLLHFRRPYVQVQQDGLKVFDDKPQPLSIHHIPICYTFGIINDQILYDCLGEEEQICNGRVTIALNIYGDVCYIHKPGGQPIDAQLLSRLIQWCLKYCKNLTVQLREYLKTSDITTFINLKKQYQLKNEGQDIDLKELQDMLEKRS